MSLLDMLDSGEVTRYHANPRLSRFGQTDAHHQWRCFVIILALHPNPSRDLLIAAATHDGGELMVGDLPYPVKKAHPGLGDVLNKIEAEQRIKIGFPHYELNEADKNWLAFADRLESTLYVRGMLDHVPTGWSENNAELFDTAERLGILEKLQEILS